MSRYFIEVSYKGTRYSGFQVQQNAITIQSEVEKALSICFKNKFALTGASRTDSGVHALQNYFHFDSTEIQVCEPHKLYNLNAILPEDIVIKRIFEVKADAHCRFDAIAREYNYYIYQEKNPFLKERSYYFPYKLNVNLLQEAALIILNHHDFTSFSKKNTQVNNFNCSIYKSRWVSNNGQVKYNVEANRFLRGMVKGLVGTMLMVGTGKISLDQLNDIISARDCTKANFAVPPYGLYLVKVKYP